MRENAKQKEYSFMKRRIITVVITVVSMLNVSAFAMTTQEFDAAMEKGIEYFNQGLYYEAKDEFTWFKQWNYGKMNSGQKQYIYEYIVATDKKIDELNEISSPSNIVENSSVDVTTMSTQEFDIGMARGINYFNQGLYYEAKDEFTWFKNAQYDRMNDGQRDYLNDYLNGAKHRIKQWEDSQANTIKLYPGAPSQYGCNYHIKVEDAIKLIKQRYGVDVVHTLTGNQFFWFEGGGETFIVDRWYPTDDINSVIIGH